MAEVNGLAAIEAELQNERASALGEAGRKLEAAVEAFREIPGDATLDELATAVWHYQIVRETAGMFDHPQALAFYGVPALVRARVGIFKRRT